MNLRPKSSQKKSYNIQNKQNKWSKKLEDLQSNLDGIKSLKNSLRHTIDELKDNNFDKENISYNNNNKGYGQYHDQNVNILDYFKKQGVKNEEVLETQGQNDTSESVFIRDITNTERKKKPQVSNKKNKIFENQQQKNFLTKEKRESFQHASDVAQQKLLSPNNSQVITLQNDDTDDNYGPITQDQIGEQNFRYLSSQYQSIQQSQNQQQKYEIMLTDVYNTKNETINKNNTSKKYNAGNGYCEDMEEVLLFLDLQNIQLDSSLIQTSTIGSWLRELNLDQYIQNFADNSIYENKSLVEYFNKQQDWHKLLITLFGIDKHGYRSRIIMKILQECDILQCNEEYNADTFERAVHNLYKIKENNKEFGPEQIKEKMLQYYTKITSKKDKKNKDNNEQNEQNQISTLNKFLISINLERYFDNFKESGYDDFSQIVQQQMMFLPFTIEYLNQHLNMWNEEDCVSFIEAINSMINPQVVSENQQGMYRPCSILKPCGVNQCGGNRGDQSECTIF